MSGASVPTLIACLEVRANSTPNQEAVLFEGESLTFGRLWHEIEGVAAALIENGLGIGDRVVLVFPNGLDFFSAFYGVQRAGGVAVPVFPDSGVERMVDIAHHCGATAIMTSTLLSGAKRREIHNQGNLKGLAVLSPADCCSISAHPIFPRVGPDHLAYLQYTSGSTGNPKGVMLTNDNLVTNIHQMIEGFDAAEDDVFVSWLPVYHDLGLIMMTMMPLILGSRLVLMPTTVESIRSWMATIAESRGTYTAAPDFAYRLALRSAPAPDTLDLSCLRVAINAAEQVRAGTIAEFESRFSIGPTVVPAYGLAEATVGVSGRRPQVPIKTDDRGLVSVGKPFSRVEVEIHGETGPVGPGEPGEIVVRSPSATTGYFENQEATQALIGVDGEIHTGDLGYLDTDGDLFIIGRKKSIIIQAGRTIAPQEIEETVDGLEFVRRSAAIGIDRGGQEGEQAWVFVELRPSDTAQPESYSDKVVEIVRAVRDRIGRRPGRVYLLQAKAIPQTYNGKIQHLQLHSDYLSGALRETGGIVYPEH